MFITTHSDYIIKELNTLIVLNQNKPHFRKLAVEEGYKQTEFLAPEKVRVFIAEVDKVMLQDGKRKNPCQTLTPASITPQFGIEARSFDTTIDKMNQIQDALIWGGDDE